MADGDFYINFHGAPPETIFKNCTYAINRYTSTKQLPGLSSALLHHDIIGDEEYKDLQPCPSIGALMECLFSRDPDQKGRALIIMCQLPENKAIRKAVVEAVREHSGQNSLTDNQILINYISTESNSRMTVSNRRNGRTQTAFHKSYFWICVSLVISLSMIVIGLTGTIIYHKFKATSDHASSLGDIPNDVNGVDSIDIGAVGGTGPDDNNGCEENRGSVFLRNLTEPYHLNTYPNFIIPPSDVTSLNKLLNTQKTKTHTTPEPEPEPDDPTQSDSSATASNTDHVFVSSITTTERPHLSIGEIKAILSPPPLTYEFDQICNGNAVVQIRLEPGRLSNTPCIERIRGVEMSGKESLKGLRSNLLNWQHVSYLKIDASEFCSYAEEDSDSSDNALSNFEKLIFPNLTFLAITNAKSECIEFYQFIDTFFEAGNLQTLDLSEVTVLKTNEDYISQLSNTFPSVIALVFKGLLGYRCDLFKENPWRLLALEFGTTRIGMSMSVFHLLKNLVSKSSLRYYHSHENVILSSESFTRLFSNRLLTDQKMFRNGKNLIGLAVTLSIDPTGIFDTDCISVHYFPKLEQLQVNFVGSVCNSTTNDSEKVKIRLKGLSHNMDRTGKLKDVEFRSVCQIGPEIGQSFVLHCRDVNLSRPNKLFAVSFPMWQKCLL